MKVAPVVCLLLLATCSLAASVGVESLMRLLTMGGVPNGSNAREMNCAACTVILGVYERILDANPQPAEKLMDEICSWFPEALREPCDSLVAVYGQDVVYWVTQHESADRICQRLNFCTDATCHLFPVAGTEAYKKRYGVLHPTTPKHRMSPRTLHSPSISPWDWLKELINRLANNHDPVVDVDQDRFSTIQPLRGSDWRGKDCEDLDSTIYPGRIEHNPENPNVDHNCNGIKGVAPNGQSYEDFLCGQSQPRGVVVLGDSAGAHFHINPDYVNGSAIHKGTYEHIVFELENEFDLPMASSTTGFEVSTDPMLPIDSIYLRMRARNRCIHRDYQNIAVNGARTGAMADGIIQSMARNNKTDSPLLMFYALIGNDVCNGHHDLGAMTTPAEFYASVLKAMQYLDTVVPPNSKVVFVGMADGRVLFDNMHNRTNPVGVEYVALYNWMNCLNISPCWVWLNDNETIRDAGSARSALLSQQYNLIIQQHKFNNFDMVYYDFPFQEVIERWHQQGGETWQLIEPVDGFHPNQISQALSAAILWEKLEAEHPDFLGPVNQFNGLIAQLFGDQGGY